MDNSGILIDTSILLEYLRTQEKTRTSLYRFYQVYDEIFVSSITVFEIFVGINPKNQAVIEQLFEGFIVLSLNTDIAKIASLQYQQLKPQNKLLEIKDLFIASTAIAYDLPIATLNTKHFERIRVLRIV